MFLDTVKGAKASAIIYSIIETVKNGVELYSYLIYTWTNMQYVGRPFSNEILESFMPWNDDLKKSIADSLKQMTE